jgi:mono/diheme cytochrome c family protein
MCSKLSSILVGLVLAILTSEASAQDARDVKRGLSLAQTLCAECHAIKKGEFRSRNGQAPTFETLASAPGISPMTIRAALQTSHREMPNMNLKFEEIDDLLTYLATLK